MADHGLTTTHLVAGRASVADLFRPGRRCGLYILYFANGEVYAGKSTDVTRRYVQHRQSFTDIERMAFRPVPLGRLDDEERLLIQQMERDGMRLRNIIYTEAPALGSDFDQLMPLDAQACWLASISPEEPHGERLMDEGLRRRFARRYERFAAMPRSHEVLALLHHYLRAGLPIPAQTEVSFWACSCLPGVLPTSPLVLSRVNVNWQEVCTIYEQDHTLWMSLHVSKAALAPPSDGLLRPIGSRLRTMKGRSFVRYRHQYRPGGQDQIALESAGLECALETLDNPAVVRAVRAMNLRLMRKGPTTFGRYHCLDLADRMFAT